MTEKDKKKEEKPKKTATAAPKAKATTPKAKVTTPKVKATAPKANTKEKPADPKVKTAKKAPAKAKAKATKTVAKKPAPPKKTDAKPASKDEKAGTGNDAKVKKPSAKPKAKKTTPKPKVKKPAAAKKKESKKVAPKKQTIQAKKPIGQKDAKGKGVKGSKKTPPAPKDAKKEKKSKKEKPKKVKSLHIQKREKQFGIGQDLQPNRDLSRMVKWPAYIRLQRRKKIMYERLKIPAMINQFTNTLDKHSAISIFTLIKKYRPETVSQRKRRLAALAKAKKENKAVNMTKPDIIKYGINHVVKLVEKKAAKLVVIANDVDPIEHVLFLPTLCRKLDIPYCIVKNKARLGTAVHLKTCTALCFDSVKAEDKLEFNKVVTICKTNFNERGDQIIKSIGGGKLGLRSSYALKKRAEALKKASITKAVTA